MNKKIKIIIIIVAVAVLLLMFVPRTNARIIMAQPYSYGAEASYYFYFGDMIIIRTNDSHNNFIVTHRRNVIITRTIRHKDE